MQQQEWQTERERLLERIKELDADNAEIEKTWWRAPIEKLMPFMVFPLVGKPIAINGNRL